MVKAAQANEALLQSAEESHKSFVDTKTKLKEVESREEALKTKLTTIEDSTKTLQEEIEYPNKEFALFKVNVEKVKEKLKIDLGEVEAEILKTYEAEFNKALCQVKYFFKDVDTSLFDVDKDITRHGELVGETDMHVEKVPDLAWFAFSFFFL